MPTSQNQLSEQGCEARPQRDKFALLGALPSFPAFDRLCAARNASFCPPHKMEPRGIGEERVRQAIASGASGYLEAMFCQFWSLTGLGFHATGARIAG